MYPEQRRAEEINRAPPGTQLTSWDTGEPSGGRKLYCYYCRQEGHYNSQCPVKLKEKQPEINMMIAEVTEVQQVTTRSKRKAVEWETQQTIRKQTT